MRGLGVRMDRRRTLQTSASAGLLALLNALLAQRPAEASKHKCKQHKKHCYRSCRKHDGGGLLGCGFKCNRYCGGRAK